MTQESPLLRLQQLGQRVWLDYIERGFGDPALRLQQDAAAGEAPSAHRTARRLAAAGIDFDSIAQQLEEEGIGKFVDPLEATLAALRRRLAELRP